MSLFGKIIKTAVNVAELPIAITKDVVTLGGVAEGRRQTHTRELAERIKEEADEG